MIVVKVELHSAITGQVTELNRVLIANDGTSDDSRRGSYYAKAIRKGAKASLRESWFKGAGVIREGRVADHPRLSAPVLNLVRKALESMGY